jgi:hypothetical protein
VDALLVPANIESRMQKNEPGPPLKKFKPSQVGLDPLAHIRQELWLKGTGSDIEVAACGEVFRLHRLIISQSSYFARLFSGDWKDSQQKRLEILIDDPNIDCDSVRAVLSVMYGNNLEASQMNFRVLAAAAFFDLQGICEQCVRALIEILSPDNLFEYIAFVQKFDYGVHSELLGKQIKWYLQSCGSSELRPQLHLLPLEYLSLLTSDLFWVPTEYDRYCVIKEVISKASLPESTVRSLLNSIHYATMDSRELIQVDADGLLSPTVLKDAFIAREKLRAAVVDITPDADVPLQAAEIRVGACFVVEDDRHLYSSPFFFAGQNWILKLIPKLQTIGLFLSHQDPPPDSRAPFLDRVNNQKVKVTLACLSRTLPAERTDAPPVFDKNDYLGYNSFIELKSKPADAPLRISVIITRLFGTGSASAGGKPDPAAALPEGAVLMLN